MAKYTLVAPSAAAPTPSGPAPGTGAGKYKLVTPQDSEYDRALAVERERAKGTGMISSIVGGESLGLADDVLSGADAAGTAIRNLADRVVGKTPAYGAGDAAKAFKQAAVEEKDRYRKDHPVGATATDLGGSLLAPLGPAFKALKKAGPLSRALGVMGIGGAAAGTQAVGESQGGVGHRLIQAPGAAAGGALTAGALHGVLSAPGAAKRAGAGLSEAWQRGKIGAGYERTGEISPEARARGEKVGMETVSRIAKRAGVTPEKLRANKAEAMGKPITAAEAIDRNAKSQLLVAGRRQGATGGALDTQLRQRNEETPQRVVRDFAEVTGIDPETIAASQTAHAEKLRKAADPLYVAWHAQTGVDSEELQALRKTDQFKEAMSKAKKLISADRESAYELLGEDGGLVPLMDRNERGEIVPIKSGGQPLNVDKNTALAHAKARGFEYPDLPEKEKIPTAKGYDYVKRGIDAVLDGYRDKTTKRLDRGNQEVRALLKVRSELGAELTNPDQPWGPVAAAAFKAGGDPIRMEEAFDAAKTLLSGTTTETQFKTRLESMKADPSQMAALKAGIVAHARDLANAGRMRLGDLTTPLSEMKLKAIFGDAAGAELIERMKIEAEMKAAGARMRPDVNSNTSDTMMGRDEQDAAMNSARSAERAVTTAVRGRPVQALTHLAASPLMGMIRGAQMPIDEASRDALGALLSGPPSALAQALEAEGTSKAEAARTARSLFESGAVDKAKARLTTAAAQTVGGRLSNTDVPQN